MLIRTNIYLLNLFSGLSDFNTPSYSIVIAHNATFLRNNFIDIGIKCLLG